MSSQDREVKGKDSERKTSSQRSSHLKKRHGNLAQVEGGQGVLSHRKGQGSQAYHSLPSVWHDVSDSK
jgi:hypothetical protein